MAPRQKNKIKKKNLNLTHSIFKQTYNQHVQNNFILFNIKKKKMSLFGLEFQALKVLLVEWKWSYIITQCIWFVFPAIKRTSQATKSIFGRSIFVVFFILGKLILRWNLTITLTLTTKSNFTLSYPNKNCSLKLTLTYSSQIQMNSFKSYSSKSNFFNLILSKVIFVKIKPNISYIVKKHKSRIIMCNG